MKKLLAAILACSMIASVGVSTLVSATDVDSSINLNGIIRNSDLGTVTTDINPDATYYVPIADIQAAFPGSPSGNFADGDQYKISFKKGSDNSKMIKKLSIETKKVSGYSDPRVDCLKIEIAADFTDKEYKISPEITFSGKKSKTGTLPVFDYSNDKYTGTMTLYVQNDDTADNDFEVGQGGIVMKPEKGEDNTITWSDNGRDVAKLDFYADSDVAKVFPKLSTKWDNSDYAEYFNDQDAFIFEFVGGSTISSTSRALLTLYNPYLNEDDELTVDSADVIIYQIIDGELVDVTDSWTKGQNDDGDEVFTSKTRVLGTYIVAEHEANIGDAGDDVEEPSTGDPIETPVKPNPSTGR